MVFSFGRCGFWPMWFEADMVCGRYGTDPFASLFGPNWIAGSIGGHCCFCAPEKKCVMCEPLTGEGHLNLLATIAQQAESIQHKQLHRKKPPTSTTVQCYCKHIICAKKKILDSGQNRTRSSCCHLPSRNIRRNSLLHGRFVSRHVQIMNWVCCTLRLGVRNRTTVCWHQLHKHTYVLVTTYRTYVWKGDRNPPILL